MDSLGLVPDLSKAQAKRVYSAAVECAARGGDLHHFVQAILDLRSNSITKARAGEIALFVNLRAHSLINRRRVQSLGVTDAIWRYSGAPCFTRLRPHDDFSVAQDEAHKAANGCRYKLAEGTFLNGATTFPGMEDGCKCFERPIVSGVGDH